MRGRQTPRLRAEGGDSDGRRLGELQDLAAGVEDVALHDIEAHALLEVDGRDVVAFYVENGVPLAQDAEPRFQQRLAETAALVGICQTDDVDLTCAIGVSFCPMEAG